MSFRGPGDGDRGWEAKEGWWGQDWNCTSRISFPASLRKKKKKAERTNVLLYCLVVSITFSSEEIYLGQARRGKKPKTCGCNVTLLRVVLGGLQSKPGAPTVTGQEPDGTRGHFPMVKRGLGLSYCTALMHGEHPQQRVGMGKGIAPAVSWQPPSLEDGPKTLLCWDGKGASPSGEPCGIFSVPFAAEDTPYHSRAV